MADYQDFLPSPRLAKSLSLSADGITVAYISDASGQFNLWTQPVAGGPARQLTDYRDRAVREVAWAPDGQSLAFTADECGDEQYQVWLISAGGGDPVQISSGTGRHFLGEKAAFGSRGQYLLYAGPSADPSVSEVIAFRLADRTEVRFPAPPFTLVFAAGISPDGTRVLAAVMDSNTECQCYVAPLDQPGIPLAPVTADLPGEYYYPGPWTGDGFCVLAGSEQGYVGLAHRVLGMGGLDIVDSPSWDVEEDVVASGDGRTLVWSVDEDGYSVLHARRDGAPLEVPAVPGGVIRAMSLSEDGSVLALLLETADRTASVVIVELGTGSPARYLTGASSRVDGAVTPELVRYAAVDGTAIPAWLYRPSGPGPHPVVLSVHGGPERQARPEYEPLHQCLLANGIAVLAPNFRGSAGYGHAWQTALYRDWGGVDLDDLAAARSWLAAQSWADPGKIAVYGMSYGGFAALSCITRLPDLWAAGVSVCGMSNLESLARSMPPDWAKGIAALFGDLNDPGDVEELHRRSPLTYASQIAAPLLVVQGATDPRVPKAESDQIVAAARANGAEVDYLVFDDEGHGFTSRANAIKAYQAIVEFLDKRLLP